MKTPRTTAPGQIIKIMFLFFVSAIVFSSCASYDKVPYFQDLSRSQITNEAITNMSLPTIQPQDRIAISVTSLNQDAANVFTNNIQNAGSNADSQIFGYLVTQQGEVTLPLLGVTKVSGLTT